MEIIIDNNDFCIRLFKDVAYIRVFGSQDESAALFFSDTIDQMLDKYPHQHFSSICNLQKLILSSPKATKIINSAIIKIDNSINYKYNAVIIKPSLTDIVKTFVSSIYLRNTKMKTKIFFQEKEAIEWLRKKGLDLKEIELFLA